MSSWQSGYVTDLGYMPGWYPQQSPMHLAVTCLLMGVACDLPADDEPVHVVELGCGLGYAAMTLAAANPSWRITGIDFNPAHVAQARSVARDAGLRNVSFLEAEIATLLDSEEGRQLPQADFVTLHGLWSWVMPRVRDGIVRFLRDKVRSGGIVHVSYNSLPGWQSALGMQRLLLTAGRMTAGNSARQTEAGLALVQEMLAAEAVHIAGPPFARRMIERLPSLPMNYLSHEYMNEGWSPCFHADVMDAFAAAKLDFIGSAALTENFAALTLTPAQRALYDRTDSPRLRELIKDLCLHRPLRHDVFVRGVQRLSDRARDAALNELVLALQTPLDTVSYEVEMAAGTATLSADFYGPILARLAQGPQSVGALLADAAPHDPRELAGVLIGIGHVVPMLRPGLGPDPAAQRFNRVAARWLMGPENLTKPLALAATAIGGGFVATVVDLFVNDRLQAGEDAGAIDRWLDMLGGETNAEYRAGMRTMLERSVTERIPLMRAASVL